MWSSLLTDIAPSLVREALARAKPETVAIANRSESSTTDGLAEVVTKSAFETIISTTQLIVARAAQESHIEQVFVLLPQQASERIVAFARAAKDILSARGIVVNVISLASLQHVAKQELAESKGTLFVPRLYHLSAFNQELEQRCGKANAVYGLLETTQAMELGSGLVFSRDLTASIKLAHTEVEFYIHAMSLSDLDRGGRNLSDNVDQRPREAVGVVSKLGKLVKNFEIGQRVALLYAGIFKTDIRQDRDLVIPVDADFALSGLACLKDIYVSWYALINVAKLVRNQCILIHGADDCLTRALVTVSNHVGAQAFVSVHPPALSSSTTSGLSIPNERLVDSGSADFANVLFSKTSGHGVDLLLSIRPNSLAVDCTSCLAEFGGLLLLRGSEDFKHSITFPLRQNITIMTVDFDGLSACQLDLAARALQDASIIFSTQPALATIQTARFSIDQLSQALSHIAETKQDRRAIMNMEPSALVLMEKPPLPPLELDSSGTYILAGGMGALGLDIARYMLDHGAGQIMVLSRSGNSYGNSKKLREFGSAGRRIELMKCDIANAQSVNDAILFLLDNKHKIKGSVQCAIVLEDEVPEALAPAIAGRTDDGSPLPSQIVLGIPASLSRTGAMAVTWTEDRKFDHFVQTGSAVEKPAATPSTRALLQQATTVQEAVENVEDFLKTFVAAATGTPSNAVDTEKSL
ncbi:hypothetical protein FKW77_000503 [Venturia effusa]|uniref:Uncharacterized protein n=1 Tax=Venturia effusa TaxID=50376 RepID=A0A517LRG0_9PEZI|nr:hypothetical protein FKW77_000503 [Venturia effusa]